MFLFVTILMRLKNMPLIMRLCSESCFIISSKSIYYIESPILCFFSSSNLMTLPGSHYPPPFPSPPILFLTGIPIALSLAILLNLSSYVSPYFLFISFVTILFCLSFFSLRLFYSVMIFLLISRFSSSSYRYRF